MLTSNTPRALCLSSVLLWLPPALAQDAVRGAQLYLQLPTVASCVSCHGPDPSQNRNNLLIAADTPQSLQKALNTVGAMGYLKSLLSETDVADLSAYLGRVIATAADSAPVALWPTTVEFGELLPAQVSPVHQVTLLNRRQVPLSLSAARLEGPSAAQFLLESDCPATLPAQSSCMLRLRAQPTVTGPASATLVLESPGQSPWVTGVTASMPVAPGSGGVLSFDLPQAAIAFAGTSLGDSAVREFRLVSHGTATVNLGVGTVTGPGRNVFRIEGDCSNFLALAPGTGCTVRLRFTPNAPGAAEATLQWRSDATNPGTVKVSGATLAAPEPVPPAAPAAPSPTPTAEPVGGGGGCSVAPPVRRVDPVLPFAIVAALYALWLRRCDVRRRGL